MATAVVLSFSNLRTDPRVNRQIKTLQQSFDVIAAGFTPPASSAPGLTYLELPGKSRNTLLDKAHAALLRFSGRYDAMYWHKSWVRAAWAMLASHLQHCDLIVANDVMMLPLGLRLARLHGARVLFDAHEYSPREFEDLWRWRLLHQPVITYLCLRYIPQVDAMTTVCLPIAEEYQTLTRVAPVVVTNATEFKDLTPVRYEEARLITLVHHGACMPSRKLECMIDLMKHVDDRFTLKFLLVGEEDEYRRFLVRKARHTGRIEFLPPVAMPELPRFLNQFDIGLFLLPPTNFNYRHALPNKLFEFIQARLGIAVGVSPEMARVVRAIGNGVVGPDYEPASLARLLNRLTAADINHFKRQSHAAAPVHSAEVNQQIMLKLCRQLVNQPLNDPLKNAG